jgi:predicted site-specific integrase-resolvase
MDDHLTLRHAASYLGFNLKTLQLWDRKGILKSHRTQTNRRYYIKAELDLFLNKKYKLPQQQMEREVIAYCRVSSRNQMIDLKNQRKVLEDFCYSKGFSNVSFIEEVGGGLNFKRKEFISIIDKINQGKVLKLIIAHKDRLTRFGFELIEHFCSANSVELLILNSERLSPEQEMVQDLMTIIHCFSSRLYGLRNYRKALKESLKK